MIKQWIAGKTKVAGTYCGVWYSGTLSEKCRPTPDYRNTIFNVTLDQPIIVFGQERRTIEIWSNMTDTITENTIETV